ncbi:MAG: DUF1272 domain-containing protein [Verrucomicrobiae bacterium]|nr:DUF1272 domain-containing protein [Verrucomicrobiae bacterium]
MPTSKEEIRRKYDLTDEEFDVVEALALRPTCEHCNKALPPDSLEARICSFECTFCATCVDMVIGNVCPNCGGGFVPRPIRPARNWKNGNYLSVIPARKVPKHKPVDPSVHVLFSAEIRKIAPQNR